MNKSRDSSKEMPGSSSAMTGRDGAVDFVAKASAAAVSEQEQTDRFCRILGSAALALWADLPQVIQEQLFERAVLIGHQGERDEMRCCASSWPSSCTTITSALRTKAADSRTTLLRSPG